MSDSIPKVEMEEAAAQLEQAAAASKCWTCGCLHDTLAAIDRGIAESDLSVALSTAIQTTKSKLAEVKYECLGCEVCYPALAVNAINTSGNALVQIDPCPTEEPKERMGWPPLPGNYFVLRYRAPVAVCTLDNSETAAELRDLAPEGLSIVGTLRTENLGIERIIRNVNANPDLRFLIICGQDTRQRIGHLPGQSLASLFANGVDERSRIIGAQGKRPVLKNLSADEIGAFRRNIALVELSGEERASVIADEVSHCLERNPGAAAGVASRNAIETIVVNEIEPLVLDPEGYFVVYPETRRRTLVLEHYRNDGVLNAVLEGRSAGALYQSAISRNLVSRLDHAAYLGRELARAEQSLKDGTPYIQDRAPEPEQARASSVSQRGCGEGSCQ